MRKRKRSYLENFQLTVFTITYVLSCILLFWLLTFLFQRADILVIIFSTLAYLLTATVGWAHLYVLFSIPQRMAGSFDYIKNNISSGSLDSVSDFSNELCRFLTGFFNYSFFDIESAAFKVKNERICFSREKLKDTLNWSEIEKRTNALDEQIQHGKVFIDGAAFYCYSTPIFFGDHYLGFFTVYSKRKLGTLMLRFLNDFENNFIDDQLMHIISKDLESQRTGKD